MRRNDTVIFYLLILFLDTLSVTSSSSEIGTSTIHSIINKIQGWKQQHEKSASARPFVTLTYAQSIDGNIALIINNNDLSKNDESQATTSENFPLSDPESLLMTHALRSIHGAILIGGRTMAVDNPRLNNRLWGVAHGENSIPKDQPRPVVLDTHLKYTRRLGNSCRASNVIACCSHEAAIEAEVQRDFPTSLELLPCAIDPKTNSLDLVDVLQKLKQNYGIQSVMVEGGASILSAFYRQQELLDCICITIAPKLLLWNGLSAIQSHESKKDSTTHALISDNTLTYSRFLTLGSDSIFLGRLEK
jgi:riboflavin-specific deaminase-like protein